jgi:hypothetical protein
MQTLYQLALVTHLIGLALLVGATVSNYTITLQFWKQYASDSKKDFGITEAMAKFGMLTRIGIVLLILSGVTMLFVVHGLFGEQTWFRIKIGLVILIITNGIAVGGRLGIKLKKTLSAQGVGAHSKMDLSKIKTRLNWFHISQIILFIIVFVLSVFKFN